MILWAVCKIAKQASFYSDEKIAIEIYLRVNCRSYSYMLKLKFLGVCPSFKSVIQTYTKREERLVREIGI